MMSSNNINETEGDGNNAGLVGSELNSLSVIADICVGDKLSNRDKILKYEEFAKTQPQIEIPVIHHIHGGMYGREITIPKGSVITGQIYKFDHFDIMLSGDITVSTDSGEVARLTGTNIFKGMSGKKRAGYAHEDTRWITFHPFDGVNGDDIQDFITADNFNELREFYIALNQSDYKNLVDCMDMTQEQIDAQVENTGDLTDMPAGFGHLYVGESDLHGSGFFSSKKIESGSVICKARISGKRTIAGRYSNHGVNANAHIMIGDDGDAHIVSIRDIEKEEEIVVNYRDVLANRFIEGDLLCQE